MEKSETCLSFCKNEETSNKEARVKATGSYPRLYRPRSRGNKRTDGRMEVVYYKSAKYISLTLAVYHQLLNCIFHVHDTSCSSFS